jgi:predicted aconitase with swiveling domain
MLYRRLHVEPLQLRLLVDHDQVNVVAAPEAVVGPQEKAVGIWGQVDARHGAAFGEYHVDEARPLVGEAVVVVAPGGRGQQDVERGDRLAPR